MTVLEPYYEDDGTVAGYECLSLYCKGSGIGELYDIPAEYAEKGTLDLVWTPYKDPEEKPEKTAENEAKESRESASAGKNRLADVPDNIPPKLRPFYKKAEDASEYAGILLYIPGRKGGYAVSIHYGEGAAVPADPEDGECDDYASIIIDEFDGDEWHHDVDGGQLDLRMAKDWGNHYNICQHVVDALGLFFELGTEYVPLQLLV